LGELVAKQLFTPFAAGSAASEATPGAAAFGSGAA